MTGGMPYPSLVNMPSSRIIVTILSPVTGGKVREPLRDANREGPGRDVRQGKE
jgi:hypothetical protein